MQLQQMTDSAEIRTAVTNLWTELLDLPDVSAPDLTGNFFMDGGDSLLATTLVAGLSAQIGVEIELGLIYRHQVFDAFTSAVLDAVTPDGRKSDATQETELSASSETSLVCLGGQREILSRYRALPEMSSGFNMLHFIAQGSNGQQRAADLLLMLSARHDGLRLRFTEEDTGLRCVPFDGSILPEQLFELPESSDQEIGPAIHTRLSHVLANPWQKPLLHLGYRQILPAQYRCVLCLHHVLSDQVGLAALRRDCLQFLASKDKEPALDTSLPAPSFIDFVQSFNARRRQPVFDSAISYWRSLAADHQNELATLMQRPRELSQTKGVTLPVVKIARDKVDRNARATGLIPVLMFLQAFSTAQNDARSGHGLAPFIGLALSVRNRVRLANCVGYFNQLIPFPSRQAVGSDATLRTAFAETMENAWVGPFEIRESMGFGAVDELRFPLFQSVLNFADTTRVDPTDPTPDIAEVKHSSDDTLHKVVLHVNVDHEVYRLRLKCNPATMPKAKMESLRTRLLFALSGLVDNV